MQFSRRIQTARHVCEAIHMSRASTFFIAIRFMSTLSTLSTSSTSSFSTLLLVLSKIQRLTISLVWCERCTCYTCKDATQVRGKRYATGSQIHPQVEQVVPRSAVPQGIWTVGFRALWLLAGA